MPPPPTNPHPSSSRKSPPVISACPPAQIPPPLNISSSPRLSETSEVPRRPRSPPSSDAPTRTHPCLCNLQSPMLATPTTIATNTPLFAPSSTTTVTTSSAATTQPTTATPSSASSLTSPTPRHASAVHYANVAAANIDMSGAQPACDNAAVLSRILARVVSNLDDHARTFWCQMMDTLALRTEAGDVQYSVSIAPYLPWHAEDAYALHEPRLRDPQISHLCPRCGGLAKRKRKRQRRRRTEFSWVEDEDDDLDDEAGSTQRLAIASFEAYICDVLGEAGKNEFVRERFYGGAPLNSRYLLAKFGTGLGMSQEELQLRQADMFDMQEDPAAMSDDDYMSGLSDVDSIHRSDNGAFE